VRGMIYALWDIEIHTLVAECGTQRDALGLVLRGIERNGPHDTDTLSLDVEDELGQVATVAYGQGLVDMAQRELTKARLPG